MCPRNDVRDNVARIAACASSGLLQRWLKCASTTLASPRWAHAAATAPAARLLRWPNGPAIRSHTLGGYGTFARRAIAGGRPLDDDQLADLVIVSYNRGYLMVHDLVARYGAQWTSHLPELGPSGAEAADYLERVRAYALLFDGAPSP